MKLSEFISGRTRAGWMARLVTYIAIVASTTLGLQILHLWLP
jgi:hypothetical protein